MRGMWKVWSALTLVVAIGVLGLPQEPQAVGSTPDDLANVKAQMQDFLTRLEALEKEKAETGALAPERAAELENLKKMGWELMGRVQQLEEAQEKPAPEVPRAEIEKMVDERVAEFQKKIEMKPVLAGYDKGFYLRSPDKAFELQLTGYMQFDSRWFEVDHPAVNQFLVRRMRTSLKGKVFNDFGFVVEPDWAGTPKLVLGYVDWKPCPPFFLRVGQQKPPFSYEQILSAGKMRFIERSLLTNLVAQEDMGITANASLFDGIAEVQFGVFNGTGLEFTGANVADPNDDKDLEGRLLFRPFKKSGKECLEGFQFGGAFTTGDQDQSPATPKFRSEGQTTFLEYRKETRLHGERSRAGAELAYFWGPFSFESEFVNMNEVVGRKLIEDNIPSNAFYAQAGWVLTGEKATPDGVTPKKDFDLKKGGCGAFELMARVAAIDVDDSVFKNNFADASKFANEAESVTLGLNWYMNRLVRVMFDWTHTNFNDPIQVSPSHSRFRGEDTVQTRFMLAF